MYITFFIFFRYLVFLSFTNQRCE